MPGSSRTQPPRSTATRHRAAKGRQVLRALDFAERSGSPATQILARLCLGKAHLALGEPDKAVALLEQAEQACREGKTGRRQYAQVLSHLSDARLGAGDAEAARETAEAGIAHSQNLRLALWEVPNQLALSRALRALDAGANRTRIVAALDRAEALATEGGIRSRLPEIEEERGRLADALGDAAEAERLLRAARRLFTEVGAEGHAARLAHELGS